MLPMLPYSKRCSSAQPSPAPTPTPTPAPNIIKFVPTGLAKMTGHKTYAAMVCNNNEYLTSMTTIPVYSFTSETLELKINAFDPATQMTIHHSIHNIHLDMPWCHAIKMMQMVGKFHL